MAFYAFEIFETETLRDFRASPLVALFHVTAPAVLYAALCTLCNFRQWKGWQASREPNCNPVRRTQYSAS